MNFWNRQANKTSYADLSDIELVQMAKDDKEAFGEIYERYLDKIYRYCYYRVGSAKDAEDLTSRVFYRALAHVDGYEDRGVPFQAWLYRIAHNLVANHHRDRSRRKIIPLDEYIVSNVYTGASTGPETNAQHMEERDRLMSVIRDLPEDRQQLLILKFVDRLSNAEIGEIMGRTEGAVKSLYHRTLLALRETLSDADDLLNMAERKAK
ncbi:MAG: sigma-70 family RNA polymerase sigma factor [Chloroflexota bacterium]